MRGDGRLSLQHGAVLLTAMIVLALTAIAGQVIFASQATAAKRQREQQLLFVGEQYRKAIQSYYNTIPVGNVRSLPTALDDLVADRRFPTPIQHLRRLYPDPMTGKPDWELIKVGNAIRGVRSTSREPVLKRAGFCEACRGFEAGERYSEWNFIARID